MKAFPLRFRQGCEIRAEKLRELRSLRYILELCSPSVPFTHDRVKLDGTLSSFSRAWSSKKKAMDPGSLAVGQRPLLEPREKGNL